MDLIDIHLHGDDDNSPIQMISARRLAYYVQVEKDLQQALLDLQGARAAVDRLTA